jgi:hypothetical protein
LVELVRAERDPANLDRAFETSALVIRTWVARADGQEGHREAKAPVPALAGADGESASGCGVRTDI